MRTAIMLFFILFLTGPLFTLSGNGTFADEPLDESILHCPAGIVTIGDTRFSVLEKCGKPTFTDEYGDVWVYDYGPSEFVRYITFVGDKVERIQLGGYGKKR